MKYTEAIARAYVAEHLADIMQGLAESRGCEQPIPEFMKSSEHFQECWKAGCWLNVMLYELGASKDEQHSIGFAMGQRSLFGNAWKWAVVYANEYAETKAVKDKPGDELANQINNQAFAAAGLKRECN